MNRIFLPYNLRGCTIKFIYLLFVSLLACSGPGNAIDENLNQGPIIIPVPVEEEEEEPFSIIIDDSDLSILPEDTGGVHNPVEKADTGAPFGYYVYKPGGYTNDGPEYPLLIFLHGWNPNLGNEPLKNVLVDGPPKLIETNRWNPKFPFIVVSPQLKSRYWPTSSIHALIENLMDEYQVNRDRIYLTGLSLGGGGCWYYAGEYEDNYLAAMVPISASGAPHLVENLVKIPIWAFHGGLDTTVKAYEGYGSVPLIEAINLKKPKIRARLTVYANVGHNAWFMTYDGTGRNYSSQTYDTFDMDIYDWMLAYKKSDQD